MTELCRGWEDLRLERRDADPYGMTTKKGDCNGNCNCNRRFPAGITKKGNSNRKRRRRFPSGMTKKRQQQPQIPCGNDKEGQRQKQRKTQIPFGNDKEGQRQPQRKTQIPFGNDKQSARQSSRQGQDGGMQLQLQMQWGLPGRLAWEVITLFACRHYMNFR